VGVRFDDRVTGKISAFAPNAKIIHIDIDPAEISKNVRVEYPDSRDARNVLKSLIKYVKIEQSKTDAWIKKIGAWKKEYPLTYKKDKLLRPQFVSSRSPRFVLMR